MHLLSRCVAIGAAHSAAPPGLLRGPLPLDGREITAKFKYKYMYLCFHLKVALFPQVYRFF